MTTRYFVVRLTEDERRALLDACAEMETGLADNLAESDPKLVSLRAAWRKLRQGGQRA